MSGTSQRLGPNAFVTVPTDHLERPSTPPSGSRIAGCFSCMKSAWNGTSAFKLLFVIAIILGIGIGIHQLAHSQDVRAWFNAQGGGIIAGVLTVAVAAGILITLTHWHRISDKTQKWLKPTLVALLVFGAILMAAGIKNNWANAQVADSYKQVGGVAFGGSIALAGTAFGLYLYHRRASDIADEEQAHVEKRRAENPHYPVVGDDDMPSDVARAPIDFHTGRTASLLPPGSNPDGNIGLSAERFPLPYGAAVGAASPVQTAVTYDPHTSERDPDRMSVQPAPKPAIPISIGGGAGTQPAGASTTVATVAAEQSDDPFRQPLGAPDPLFTASYEVRAVHPDDQIVGTMNPDLPRNVPTFVAVQPEAGAGPATQS